MTTLPHATPATSAFASVAPLEHKPRRFVLCFDDTAHPYQSISSNVFKLVLLVRNEESQMIYYQVRAHFSVLNALMCL